jgi:hypothetical protein
MHVASKGKFAGKWVRCPAQGKCRVGGTHVSSEELKEVKKWVEKKKLADVTPQDRVSYKKAVLDGQAAPVSQPVAKFEHSLVAQLKEERAGKKFPSWDRLSEDERDAAEAMMDNSDGKFEKVVNVSFSPNKWRYFVNRTVELDINVPLDALKAGGEQLRNGNRRVELEGIPLRGDKKLITELTEFLRID